VRDGLPGRNTNGGLSSKVSSDAQTIPVQLPSGKIAQMNVSDVLANASRFELRYNKRGNLRFAAMKDRLQPTTVLSNDGSAFLQQLPSGSTWALTGVTGS
jgi:hypothetical protein